MYTHLFIDHDSADTLFDAFAPKPLKEGEIGVVTGATLDEHFAQYGQTYLGRLGCTLERDRRREMFVLKFGDYLPQIPQLLLDCNVEIMAAEIVRFNSSVTRAQPGYYEGPAFEVGAIVEPVASDHSGLNAQNIRVWGPALDIVQEYHEKLCTGDWEVGRVRTFA